ncbi:GNAT family N-acetyltransferase [Actinomadura violacea]|uniref:GNAT family N-acetyltransferase n=1 Tax=Actinomadura violacea TaxID=2819934 RepID=A0ABS3RVV7_9ACTN|nr:GNAT family N-acetyltransferase [Actinomadura violacea]MBO2460894.1 GNAT family N-acetyltransferase [Actinomadura violacea]
MPELDRPPRLVRPTVVVRASFLAGERADRLAEGATDDWSRTLDDAARDFDAFVARVGAVRRRWGVPCSTFWYVSGEHYVGTLIIRHRLTPELAEAGGHIGYHVVTPWRRQGHATAMLAEGIAECRRLGLERVLLTCAAGNEPSRRVIQANGGVPDGRRRGGDRFWIAVRPQ